MKNLLNFKRLFWVTLIIAGITTLQSCVVYRPYPTSEQLVTVPDIIRMSKDGASSKDIINEIQKSHTAYNLKADQLAKLHDQGVQDSVINYMEQTKIDLIQQNQSYADSSYWWMSNGFYYGAFGLGLGWGWPNYGYYGWGWGPTVIYNVRPDHSGVYHGGFHGGGEGFHGGLHRGFRR
jgi:hypothetical protein